MRRGAFIVVCGPDGSGKTTLARELLDGAEEGYYFHFLPSPISDGLSRIVPDDQGLVEKNRSTGSRFLGWLRIARNLARAWAGYLFSIRPAIRRGAVVVGDRWLYGYVAQPLALKFNGPENLARAVLSLAPRPDLVAVLDAPPEVIRSRKAELSIDEISRERQLWSTLPGDVLSLDATRASRDLATECLRTVEFESKLVAYPPRLGHVLIPAGSRRAALAATTLYAPTRTRARLVHSMSRAMIRAVGPQWLPDSHPGSVPLPLRDRSAVVEFAEACGIEIRDLAFYTRIQADREGYSILVIAGGRPTGFIRVGPKERVDSEVFNLGLLANNNPETFDYPKVLGTGMAGGLALMLQSVVLFGNHRPPRGDVSRNVASEIGQGLRGLPRDNEVPDHWVPIHGDFTPWNLRAERGALSLIDWEDVGWGPPDADIVLYQAASRAVGTRSVAGVASEEARMFWLDRLTPARPGRDDRLRGGIIASLRRSDEG